MNKMLLTLLLLALAATAQQQKRIAIVNTVDDGDRPITVLELSHLTDRLREIANKTLPQKSYAIMTQQSMLAYLGTMDKMVKKCKESEGCLAKLGREVNADYVCQARIGRFGKDLTIKAELYESKNGDLISSFTGTSKNIYGLLSVLDKEAPNMFGKITDAKETASQAAAPPAPISANTLYDARDGKKYRTVKIGKQIWMAQNLDYHGEDGFLGLCYGDNPQEKIRNPENCKKYGRLYNLEEAEKACPEGWHLPTIDELEALMKFIGSEEIAGKKLKSKSGWAEFKCKWTEEKMDERGRVTVIEHDICPTDEYGFSALPGGYGRFPGGYGNGYFFENIGIIGYWWITGGYEYTHYFTMNYNYVGGGWVNNYQHGDNLLSVRCLD
ncbi:MAG: hypothetical protein LBQ76_09760 [Candidatus Fibromonas sp.]|jgi:uncharacterized protein (TIGR02145 family)|nr:hypothetical protein [Candidatus Fibromonas sp.]